MKLTRDELTPELLRTLLRYEPETGEIFWREYPGSSPRAKALSGKPALASKDADGYKKGSIGYQYVKAHRVAWAIYYGQWPEIIDHINGDVADNRIENLRSVDEAESHRNLPRPKTNKSGAIGVCWVAKYGTWQATIRANKKPVFLGYFETFEEAVAARKEAERRHGYHPNHGRGAETSAA